MRRGRPRLTETERHDPYRRIGVRLPALSKEMLKLQEALAKHELDKTQRHARELSKQAKGIFANTLDLDEVA